MNPLNEEAEAPQYEPEVRAANDPTHRRLQAIAGAGVGYVLITFPEGAVTFDSNLDDVIGTLNQVVEALS